MSDLLELADGTLVEVQTERGKGYMRYGVRSDTEGAFSGITPLLVAISEPVAQAYWNISGQSGVKMRETEIELGLNFEAEGNIYVAKSKQEAAIHIKLVLEPDPDKNYDYDERVSAIPSNMSRTRFGEDK